MSSNGVSDLPISKELLDILRCPMAVQDKTAYGDDPGRLELVKNSWLVSADSGLKYPIRDGIPIMLIDEGMKWKDTPADALPVPPPAAAPVPESSGASSAPLSQNSADSGTSPTVILGAIVAFLAVLLFLRSRA